MFLNDPVLIGLKIPVKELVLVKRDLTGNRFESVKKKFLAMSTDSECQFTLKWLEYKAKKCKLKPVIVRSNHGKSQLAPSNDYPM